MRRQRSLILLFALATVLLSASPCNGQDRAGQRALSFWTVGSDGAGARFGADLFRTLEHDRAGLESLLLAIAERPRSEDQILEATNLSHARLRDLLARLSSVRVIAQDGRGRWKTTLPVITDNQMKQIRRSLVPLARAVADNIGDAAPRLVVLYDRVKSASDPRWDNVAHLVVDKFLVDGTFHTAIGELDEQHGFLQRYYSQAQRIIPAFFIERGDNFSTIGSNWYPYLHGDEQREVYVLHGAVFDRYDIQMNAHRSDTVLTAALFGITPAGGIESLNRSERDTLRALEWVAGDRLLVSVVRATTIKALWPLLEEIGAGAAAVVIDDHSIFTQSFDRSPYAAFLDGGGDYVQVCYHALFGLVLEQLAESGVVPRFPDPVPEHFGVYIILGKSY
jgi:hypothetical protein